MGKPTMKEYMTKTREDYGLGIARQKFDKDAKFELKGQSLKGLRDSVFNGSENADANEHIERVLEIVDLFTRPDVTQDQLMLRVFPITLTRTLSRWVSTRSRSNNTSDGLADIQAQPKNLDREIKKVDEKVYATQVGCELCNGPM
nr:hypothetical protein [Tanacetum cinerariifolium]